MFGLDSGLRVLLPETQQRISSAERLGKCTGAALSLRKSSAYTLGYSNRGEKNNVNQTNKNDPLNGGHNLPENVSQQLCSIWQSIRNDYRTLVGLSVEDMLGDDK